MSNIYKMFFVWNFLFLMERGFSVCFCFSFNSPAHLQTLPRANENKFWVKLWKDHFHTTPVTFWSEGFDKL